MLCRVQSNEEAPGPPMLIFPPPQPSPRSFVLADRLARVSFAYQEITQADPLQNVASKVGEHRHLSLRGPHRNDSTDGGRLGFASITVFRSHSNKPEHP